jgi:hypothetical protein
VFERAVIEKTLYTVVTTVLAGLIDVLGVVL